jgi:WD40 repeat protein
LAIASGTFKKVGLKLWDVQTAAEKMPLPIREGVCSAIAFSIDGKRIAAFSTDNNIGTVTMCDVLDGKQIWEKSGLYYTINNLAFSPEGTRLALASQAAYRGGGGVRLWDAASGQELLVLDTQAPMVYGVQFSPDGRRLASTTSNTSFNLFSKVSTEIKIWDATPITRDADK